ncbi:MAG: phage tail assembly protein [Bosea sp. (in: a-proteobacteria)]|nr:phage tail assembly protein [Bosea sp. (in: a-proteobacteria)]
MSDIETVTVKLSRPIEVDGKQLHELSFRPTVLGDLCVSDQLDGEMSKTAAVLARMAGVPIQAMKQVLVRDIFTVIERVSPLLCIEAPAAAPGFDMPVTH